MQRPFKVTLNPQSPPGELRVAMTFAAAADEERGKQVRQVLADFAGLALSGALAGDRIPPASTSIHPLPAEVSDRGASQKFADVLLHPAALSCLLNLLEWMHHHVISLAEARLSWERISELRDPLAIAFPPVWPKLGYHLELDELERRFQIEVLLEQPQSQEILDGITEHLGLWCTGLSRGAYGNESICPAESAMFFSDEAVEAAEDHITWSIDAFRCDDAALDGLENALEWIHRKRTPIRRVLIG